MSDLSSTRTTTTSELVEEFRRIVSVHHGYIPTDFAADCLAAVLQAVRQDALDYAPYSPEAGR